MLACDCAVCGEPMMLSNKPIGYITPIGIVHNLCGADCLKIFNNSDVVLKKAISTKEIGSNNEHV